MSIMMCEYCDSPYDTDVCDGYHEAECEDCGGNDMICVEEYYISDRDALEGYPDSRYHCLDCDSYNVLEPECCS